MRVKEIKQSSQQERFDKDEAKVIADLQRRIAELERSKEALQLQLTGRKDPRPKTPPLSDESNQSTIQDSNRKLIEVIRALEQRLSSLEEEVRKGSHALPPRNPRSR